LVRASHNREIIEAYLRVSGRIRAIRFRLTRTDELTRSAQKDHRAITKLVVARKYEEAELPVGKHVYNGYRTFVATLKAEDSVGPLGGNFSLPSLRKRLSAGVVRFAARLKL
jgi:DNA-binding GntR family transcriptional regulator